MSIKSAQTSYVRYLGFTLIEILTVMAILVVMMAIPIILNYRSARSNQALAASIEEFANQARTVHIYAREAKDSKAWGLRKSSESSYQVISGTDALPVVVTTLTLESQIKFTNVEFVVWFNEGFGDTDADQRIEMVNVLGKKASVSVYKTGLIETTGIY